MTHIVFFEIAGCAGNARQRRALEAAGPQLERRNLLTCHWTAGAGLATLPTRKTVVSITFTLWLPGWLEIAGM